MFTQVMGGARYVKEFQESNSFELEVRLKAISQNLDKIFFNSRTTARLGRNIYASSDPHLFKEPGLSMKPRGFEGLENLPYIWIPKAFMPNQPEVLDGHLISKEVEGNPNQSMDQGRHISFPSLTLSRRSSPRFLTCPGSCS